MEQPKEEQKQDIAPKDEPKNEKPKTTPEEVKIESVPKTEDVQPEKPKVTAKKVTIKEPSDEVVQVEEKPKVEIPVIEPKIEPIVEKVKVEPPKVDLPKVEPIAEQPKEIPSVQTDPKPVEIDEKERERLIKEQVDRDIELTAKLLEKTQKQKIDEEIKADLKRDIENAAKRSEAPKESPKDDFPSIKDIEKKTAEVEKLADDFKDFLKDNDSSSDDMDIDDLLKSGDHKKLDLKPQAKSVVEKPSTTKSNIISKLNSDTPLEIDDGGFKKEEPKPKPVRPTNSGKRARPKMNVSKEKPESGINSDLLKDLKSETKPIISKDKSSDNYDDDDFEEL